MDYKQVRVACYARYSTSMQREESISAQMRAMKKFCDDNGWIIVKKYVDEAYSATTDKRPQFQEMISDSCNKEFDIVLVHKLDRFARNRYDSSQDYIHSVTVNRKTVTVRLIVDGEARMFRHGRKTFKTPKQRCFQ